MVLKKEVTLREDFAKFTEKWNVWSNDQNNPIQATKSLENLIYGRLF